jgi:uroporphyrinogen III methyltransferase/synthase
MGRRTRIAMTVYLVGAGPGDPGLITVRGAELVARADVVIHDRLVEPSLLELAPRSARIVDVGKTPGAPRSQDDISNLLIDLGRSHETVVRLKGGDPFLFGRGGEEVEALLKAGLEVEVVPGITSAFAAPAYAGIPVTHRGLANSVTVVTGHVGDPSAPGGVDWDALARAGGTIVVLMGMATRAEIARRLIEGGRPASTPVAVVEWGTTPGQRAVRTTLDALWSVELGSPATIVVGAVAGLELPWLEQPPLAGWSVVVTRPVAKAPALSSALRRAGASVVSLPSIAIAGPRDGGKGLEEAANAAVGFLHALGDARTVAGVRIAAVGPATAATLLSGRLPADLVAVKSSAVGLVDSIGPRTGGGRVLFCRAAEALPTLAGGLRTFGWEVDEVETYTTVSPGPEDGVTQGAIARASDADAAVFASPSAVRGLVTLLESADGPVRLPPVAVCIGKTTASAASDAGFALVVTATQASDEGLVAATVVARAIGSPG